MPRVQGVGVFDPDSREVVLAISLGAMRPGEFASALKHKLASSSSNQLKISSELALVAITTPARGEPRATTFYQHSYVLPLLEQCLQVVQTACQSPAPTRAKFNKYSAAVYMGLIRVVALGVEGVSTAFEARAHLKQVSKKPFWSATQHQPNTGLENGSDKSELQQSMELAEELVATVDVVPTEDEPDQEDDLFLLAEMFSEEFLPPVSANSLLHKLAGREIEEDEDGEAPSGPPPEDSPPPVIHLLPETPPDSPPSSPLISVSSREEEDYNQREDVAIIMETLQSDSDMDDDDDNDDNERPYGMNIDKDDEEDSDPTPTLEPTHELNEGNEYPQSDNNDDDDDEDEEAVQPYYDSDDSVENHMEVDEETNTKPHPRPSVTFHPDADEGYPKLPRPSLALSSSAYSLNEYEYDDTSTLQRHCFSTQSMTDSDEDGKFDKPGQLGNDDAQSYLSSDEDEEGFKRGFSSKSLITTPPRIFPPTRIHLVVEEECHIQLSKQATFLSPPVFHVKLSVKRENNDDLYSEMDLSLDSSGGKEILAVNQAKQTSFIASLVRTVVPPNVPIFEFIQLEVENEVLPVMIKVACAVKMMQMEEDLGEFGERWSAHMVCRIAGNPKVDSNLVRFTHFNLEIELGRNFAGIDSVRLPPNEGGLFDFDTGTVLWNFGDLELGVTQIFQTRFTCVRHRHSLQASSPPPSTIHLPSLVRFETCGVGFSGLLARVENPTKLIVVQTTTTTRFEIRCEV
ncbi:hypothetical protein BASA81_011091 [Batrachochytrium salamandrivorans]|nr:hypothetical protein BASA81_011091 [Batrachochytrium salamandrivorans]